MTTKFSVFRIVSNHFNTLYNYRKSNDDKIVLDYTSIFINFFLPFILAFVFIWFKLIIQQVDFISLIVAFSVLSVFLVNLMILLYSILNREKENLGEKRDAKKIKLINETFANIQFAVLSSIGVVIIVLFMLLIPSNFYIDLALSFITYYLVFVSMATILMVLKRTNSIISG